MGGTFQGYSVFRRAGRISCLSVSQDSWPASNLSRECEERDGERDPLGSAPHEIASLGPMVSFLEVCFCTRGGILQYSERLYRGKLAVRWSPSAEKFFQITCCLYWWHGLQFHLRPSNVSCCVGDPCCVC